MKGEKSSIPVPTAWLPGVLQAMARFPWVFSSVVLSGDRGSNILRLEPATFNSLCEFNRKALALLVLLLQ